VKLLKKTPPHGHAGRSSQMVEAVYPQAKWHSIQVKSIPQINTLLMQHLLDAEGMPEGHDTLHP
jgi:hypothetical protein